MDALRKDDLERARNTAPGEKLRQALELMQLGIDMKRRRLRAADPSASEHEIEARLLAWMSAPPMTPEEALVDVTARLTRLGVSHALVGGLAISIRAEVRFTRDVDLAIAVDSDADVERITRALAAEGFALVAVVEQDEKKRIAIARLRSPSGIVVDLLAASSGIEREIVGAARETSELPGVPVAMAEHLLAMKVLSMRDARLQDRIDARGLLATGPVDVAEVRRLLALIAARGFGRGQDLGAKLDALLAERPE